MSPCQLLLYIYYNIFADYVNYCQMTKGRIFCHPVYGEHKALVDINEGNVIKGYLPTKQIKLVLAWCEIHREELIKNWEISKEAGTLLYIEALK